MQFDDFFIPEPNSGCFLWLGSLTASGHGIWKGKAAHRYVCEGLTDEKPLALHKCDVACCVNPDHLFPGTHKENMQDMVFREHIKKICKIWSVKVDIRVAAGCG